VTSVSFPSDSNLNAMDSTPLVASDTHVNSALRRPYSDKAPVMRPRSSFVLHRVAEEAIHPDYGRVARYLTIEIASAEFVLNRPPCPLEVS
jgi:hypothetical protein